MIMVDGIKGRGSEWVSGWCICGEKLAETPDA